MKDLVFRLKNPVFQIKKFEILRFSDAEFEILGISSKIPGISKTWNFFDHNVLTITRRRNAGFKKLRIKYKSDITSK